MEKADLTNAKESMRRDWDERARRNAFLYIASWRNDWDEASFFESGERDYLQLVAPILQNLNFDPAAHTMAELGCGAGRMTRSLAGRFRRVIAVDISAEMQSRAKQYLTSFSNVDWVLSDGETLSGIAGASVDFVFSYLVLQHLPSKELVVTSIREMMRILKPGGAFLFQYNGSNQPTMNWKGRLLSAVLDQLASVGLKSPAQTMAHWAGIDSEMVGRTWRGAALTQLEIESAARLASGTPAGFLDPDTPMAWCYGRKATEDHS